MSLWSWLTGEQDATPKDAEVEMVLQESAQKQDQAERDLRQVHEEIKTLRIGMNRQRVDVARSLRRALEQNEGRP